MKIVKMLDLLKMVKDNRKFKVLLKNSLMSQEISEHIKHTKKFFINLSDSSASDEID